MPKIKEFGYKKQESTGKYKEWKNMGQTDTCIMKKKKGNYELKIEGAIGSQNSIRSNLTTTTIFTLIINNEKIALDNYGFIVEDKNLDLREVKKEDIELHKRLFYSELRKRKNEKNILKVYNRYIKREDHGYL